MDAEHEVRDLLERWARLLERWARSVAEEDREGLVAERAGDVVVFDVPPPLQLRGLDAHRAQWELFFDAQGAGTSRFDELDVVAGDDVAHAFGVLVCGTNDPATHSPVRLTVGLRRRAASGWSPTSTTRSSPDEVSRVRTPAPSESGDRSCPARSGARRPRALPRPTSRTPAHGTSPDDEPVESHAARAPPAVVR